MDDVEEFDRKVADLHATLEAACNELAHSQTSDYARVRTRAFGMFVQHMERAIEKYEHLPDE